MADSRAPNADAPSTHADAGAGPEGSVDDAAGAADFDASRDSQAGDGAATDGGAFDGSTFVCGSSNPVACAVYTQYCTITRSNQGELPVPVNACEALAALSCFSTNAGCHCSSIPFDAGACRCLEPDASSAVTIDCF